MRNLINNNIITLKGTWECFIIFLKFIKSIIDGLWNVAEKFVLSTNQPIDYTYLFVGLIVIYSDVNNTIKKSKTRNYVL